MTANELRKRRDELRAKLETLCAQVVIADPAAAAAIGEQIADADDELAAVLAGLRPEVVSQRISGESPQLSGVPRS